MSSVPGTGLRIVCLKESPWIPTSLGTLKGQLTRYSPASISITSPGTDKATAWSRVAKGSAEDKPLLLSSPLVETKYFLEALNLESI